jgi:leader peptidase (prepilin peptidase)/N-methyltransferase
MTMPTWTYVSVLLCLGAGCVSSAWDVKERRIPNAVTVPAFGLGLVAQFAAADGAGSPSPILLALAGAAVWGAFYLACAFGGAMGMGDVKLGAVLGLGLGPLGWGILGAGLALGLLAGGVHAAVVLGTAGGARDREIPYGPWMTLGALAAVLVAAP